MAKLQLSALLVVAVCCVMAGQAKAVIHIVGGGNGWQIPPNTTFFADWAKPRTFGVQDKLFFPFRIPFHNVVEVGSQDDFDHCSINKLITMYTKGPLTLTFTKPGDYYYFSGIGTQCEAGMKLHVKVVPGLGSSGRKLALRGV